ncbi:MAG: hypothetical protein ACE5F9_09010 [Phycisphaerae bacterium]
MAETVTLMAHRADPTRARGAGKVLGDTGNGSGLLSIGARPAGFSRIGHLRTGGQAAGGTRATSCYMIHALVIEGLPTDYGPAEPFPTDQ